MDQFWLFTNTVNSRPVKADEFSCGVDPSTKERLWDVPLASNEDADDAVAASRAAFSSWAQTQWSHRQELLLAARKILLENKSNMATLLTKEGGKPVGSSAANTTFIKLS